MLCYYHTHQTVEGSVFGAVSLCFLFVYEIFPELLNGFAPNSHGRRVCCLTNLNVKVKCQGHQEQKQHFQPFWRPVCGLCLVKHLQPLV